VRGVLDQLGIDKASLVGNSMGGQNSLAFALDYPERTDKLILMGAAGAGQSMFVPQPSEGIKILVHTFAEPTAENMRKLIEVMVYDSSFLTDELLQQRVKAALATRRPGGPPVLGGSTIPQREISYELGNVNAKTLVIWGRDDRVVPLDWSLRFLWGIPDAQLHIFSKCGHWAQFEHAEEFNRLVEDFLANN
jgi:2-hydroxy-6-oxonona-2,4-dienedioate hydrolase